MYLTVGEISSSQVIKGNGKWLFYKGTSETNSMADFEGTNRYSQDDMKAMAQVAKQTQEILANKGIKFAIIVAPNKENIYAEFMPDIYIYANVSSRDLLIEYMAQNGVNIIYPKADLLANHLDQLYYSYDIHWKQLGAYIWTGRNLKLNRINSEVSHYSNPDAEVVRKVLLVEDSFRFAIVPSLKEAYYDVYVMHRLYYTSAFLNKIEPDYLSTEYVERYSIELKEIEWLFIGIKRTS